MDDLYLPSDIAMARIATHEAVCAERYANILARLVRLEALMIGAATAVIGAMATALMALLRII